MSSSKGTILITDSLFVFSEHEKRIKNAGYDIERFDKPNANEDELIDKLQGKVGYILGGIEKVTDKVINSTIILKAIAFTGSDWRQFIPGYITAQEKGIKITNTPGANAHAVAEYTILSMLTMVRSFCELTNTGTQTFQTTHSLSEMTVGIIGTGKIGREVIKLLKGLGVSKILYYSRTRNSQLEENYNIEFVSLETLLKECHIVSLHVSKEAGNSFIGKHELSFLQDDAIIINCGFTGCVDQDALFLELQNGRIRAFQDDPMDERYNALSKHVRLCSNSHTAFNTYHANKLASDMAVNSILNILDEKEDNYIVI